MSLEVEKQSIIKGLQEAFTTARKKFYENSEVHLNAFVDVAGVYLAEEGLIVRDTLMEELLLKECQARLTEELIKRKLNLGQIVTDVLKKWQTSSYSAAPSVHATLLSKILQPHFLSWTGRAEMAEARVETMAQTISDLNIDITDLRSELDTAKQLIDRLYTSVQLAADVIDVFPPGRQTSLSVDKMIETYDTMLVQLKEVLATRTP